MKLFDFFFLCRSKNKVFREDPELHGSLYLDPRKQAKNDRFFKQEFLIYFGYNVFSTSTYFLLSLCQITNNPFRAILDILQQNRFPQKDFQLEKRTIYFKSSYSSPSLSKIHKNIFRLLSNFRDNCKQNL